jgi:nucleolar protein 58
VLPEELVEKVRAEAEISMGTDVSDQDIDNIRQLCDQVFFCFLCNLSIFFYDFPII